MKTFKTFAILLLLLLSISCSNQNKKTKYVKVKTEIDDYLYKIIELHNIPGLALAVIKDDKIVYEGYFGKASMEDNTPVNENTIFGIFSTTKLISTVGVFQLVEKSKLNLEDKISKYLDNLPDEWEDIKIKNLLTHSSGLPDVVRFEDIPYSLPDEEKLSRLSKKSMQFETGNQFSYNQTNYWLLTQIIEQVTGMTFDDFILRTQFPMSEEGVVFSSDATEEIPNRANKYNFDNKLKKYVKSTVNNGFRAHSGNGMNITLQEFVQWNRNLDNNSLLEKETKQLMWQPFGFKNKKDNFLYGWGTYMVNNKPSYGFSGGNVTAFRKFIEADITVIFLSNGYKYFDIQDQVVNHVAGLVDENLIDQYSLSKERIAYGFLKNEFEKAEHTYLTIKRENPDWDFERKLNSIGYVLMRNDRSNDAMKIFKLNVEENPKSGNAYDSLAEGYFKIGQLETSKENYKKSLELNPKNNNAKAMISEIENLLK